MNGCLYGDLSLFVRIFTIFQVFCWVCITDLCCSGCGQALGNVVVDQTAWAYITLIRRTEGLLRHAGKLCYFRVRNCD